jgi:hypothetical protein
MRELARQLDELVYEDGAFAQHSLIYHRVLLHDLVWCRCRLLRAARAVPAWLEAAGRRATEFLLVVVEPRLGRAPLYGSNDGSNVLPLTDTDYGDMRPVLQAATAAFMGECCLPAGPWDEAVFWLVGVVPKRTTPASPAFWHAPVGGCAVVRAGDTRAFFRCPTKFLHRPAQADMLQVDITWRGLPVTLDPGSFSYNSIERFGEAFKAAAGHNALTIDGQEPLRAFSRFLYLPWPRGSVQPVEGGFVASHNGFTRLQVRWQREVRRGTGDTIEIIDELEARRDSAVNWHWRLVPGDWKLDKNGDAVRGMVGGSAFALRWSGEGVFPIAGLRSRDPMSGDGWWSPSYSTLEAAISLRLVGRGSGRMRLCTIFGPAS